MKTVKWLQEILIDGKLYGTINRENQVGEVQFDRVMKPDLSGPIRVKRVFTENGWCRV